MNKTVKLTGLIIKAVVAFFMGWILLGLFAFTIEEVHDSRENTTTTLNRCDRYYNERNFDSLSTTLSLYDTHNEKFDVYWEAINAYNEYNAYIQWKKADLVGVKDAGEMAEQSLNKLNSMAAKPKCERNQKLLNDFANKARDYKDGGKEYLYEYFEF